MKKEGLKDILLNSKEGDFEKIMNYQITKEDVENFYNMYEKYISLENNYKNTIVERKKLRKN